MNMAEMGEETNSSNVFKFLKLILFFHFRQSRNTNKF